MRNSSRDPARPALRTFLHGLIVEEFDGAEPPSSVLDGLTSYVRALDPAACAGKGPQVATLAVQVGDIVLDLGRVRRAWADSDLASAHLVMGGIRNQLGQIAARYQSDERDVKHLVALDRQLASIEDRNPVQADTALTRWTIAFARVVHLLKAHESRSLYDADTLSRWLKRSASI